MGSDGTAAEADDDILDATTLEEDGEVCDGTSEVVFESDVVTDDLLVLEVWPTAVDISIEIEEPEEASDTPEERVEIYVELWADFVTVSDNEASDGLDETTVVLSEA